MSRVADYIVVGSGSAGAIIARRLSDAGASVLLVEAGRRDDSDLVRLPGMMGAMHSVPQLQKRVTWKHYTVPQRHALGRRMPQTTGKVVGGSSGVNGMLFVRGNRRNFDDWADAGNKGWSYDDVLPYFKKFESFEDGASDLRGGDGPVQVIRARQITSASEQFLEALSSTTQLPRNHDYNGEEQEGVSLFQQSNGGGRRFSTAHAYLSETSSRLRLVTETVANRVVIEGGRAVGVEVQAKDGSIEILRANREVVVSAGTYGSPKLLMLSGVGPADHLRAHGIDVEADLPVGDNLQDHLFVPTTYSFNGGRIGSPVQFARAMLGERLNTDSTWMARSLFEGVSFLRSQYSSGIPDVQLHVLPFAYPSPNQDAPIFHQPVTNAPAITVLSTLIYPHSRGRVRLGSGDPAVAPRIDPNYLADPNDVDVLLEGVDIIRETMAHPSLSGLVGHELTPGRAFTGKTTLTAEIRNRISTVYHPVGTCRMGVDQEAVVDPELRVRGLEGLRVADASVMPTITGGNTNAPTLMIGERAADLLLAD